MSCARRNGRRCCRRCLSGETVKPRGGAHPRVFIWGALEARLQHVDTMVLAGLNERTWPGQTSNDAFLSRSMKTAIGLEPPERRIGQAAHDFQMALGTPRRRAQPCRPRRHRARLSPRAGCSACSPSSARKRPNAMRARGRTFVDWAETLDRAAPGPLCRAARAAPAARQAADELFLQRGRSPAPRSLCDLCAPHPAARADCRHGRAIRRLPSAARSITRSSRSSAGRAWPVDDPQALDRLRADHRPPFRRAEIAAACRRDMAPALRPGRRTVSSPGSAGAAMFARATSRPAPGRRSRRLASRSRALADRIDIMADGTGGDHRLQDRSVALAEAGPGAARSAACAGGRGAEARRLQRHPADGDVRICSTSGSSRRRHLRVDQVDNKNAEKPDTRSAAELADEALKQFVGFVSVARRWPARLRLAADPGERPRFRRRVRPSRARRRMVVGRQRRGGRR